MSQRSDKPPSLWHCAAIIVAVGAVVVLPFVNGLCAGLVGGRLAGSPRRAVTAATLAVLPLGALLAVVLAQIAPQVAVVWVAGTLVTLAVGLWCAIASQGARSTSW